MIVRMRTNRMPRMSAAQDTQFLVLVEAGALEAQASLLCKSLRCFGGRYAKAPIVAVSPRRSRRPSRDTLRGLAKLDVEYVEAELHSPCPEYGPSYRVSAAALIESLPGPDILVQVDSDTLFLGEPDFALTGVDVAARPVDVRGICAVGDDDACERYWRQACTYCGVDFEQLPWVTTTVDKRRVRANYNGGLIAARRGARVFARTEEFLLRLVRNEHASHPRPASPVNIGSGEISAEGFRYWGTSQITLSLACAAQAARVAMLPTSHNIPLHYFDALAPLDFPPVHVHYHWLGRAEQASANPLLNGRLELPRKQMNWVREHLPIDRPERPIPNMWTMLRRTVAGS